MKIQQTPHARLLVSTALRQPLPVIGKVRFARHSGAVQRSDPVYALPAKAAIFRSARRFLPALAASGERRAGLFQLRVDGFDTFRDIRLQGSQEQRPLVTEGVIHALSTNIHDTHQLISGCGGKALLRKQGHRLPKCFLLIELLLPGHFFFVFLVCFSYATYPPSMVRLAPVMEPASSDAR